MKYSIIIVLTIFSLSCKGQSESVIITNENFDTEFFNYKPIQRDGVSQSHFEHAQIILSETFKALKNNPDNYNVAHYWNIATAFSTLKEKNEYIKIAFLKATKSEGVCEYFESFKNVKNHFSRHIPDIYNNEQKKCLEKKQAKNPFNLEVYSKKNNLDLELVKLVNNVSENDQKFRSADIAKQHDLDFKNQKIIDSLFQKYKTYIGKSLVGNKYQSAMWAVIQHSNIEMMEKYLPIIQNAVKQEELPVAPFKMLIDRVYWINNGHQIFGSQAGVDLADKKTRMEIAKKYGVE